MQKLCCVRTRQRLCQFGLFRHNFTTISPPILNHFWWELYHLDPSYSPGHSPEEKELFEAKQVFMYKVFNETLQTDMGRTTVRKYLRSTDAQAVWKEYSDYMTTSSKGASEKRKLTHYVTNTVLDNQFRGTTQQFVLHFNEQFRRLDELTDLSQRMPDSIKMALLQNAVKDIPQLSIVETLDEYTSTTSGDGSFTHLNYLSYYNLLINACVRYDATNTSTPSKRRNVYAAWHPGFHHY